MSAGLPRCICCNASVLFPIPHVPRMAPLAAGFPQAEEHVLTTADGEKVIVWHVPAKPGRPVILYFHGNGDFLAGFFGRFRDMIADGTGVVALSYRGYFGSSGRAERAGPAEGRRGGLRLHDGAIQRRQDRGLGLFARHRRRGGAGGRAADRQADSRGALYVDRRRRGRRRFRSFRSASLMKDPFHSDRRIARVKAPLLIMHGARDPTIPIAFGERLFALANEPKKFVRFDRGGHNDLDDFGATETARQFINARKRLTASYGLLHSRLQDIQDVE